LDDSERERADKFRVATARNQHVVGRGMARRLLGNHRIDPHRIRFALEDHGKPYVTEPDEAKQLFNIAHTDGLVMCGIGNAGHQSVGIDVERLNRRTDPELAQRYFSEPEVRFLREIESDSARQIAFLRIWTLKESFIKALGTGLQTPLADFAFEEIESDSPSIRMLNPDLEADLHWKFFSLQPRPGFIGAVAVATDSAAKVELELHRFEELIA
jgi:4'-phosphopantetheinyl transferase